MRIKLGQKSRPLDATIIDLEGNKKETKLSPKQQ